MKTSTKSTRISAVFLSAVLVAGTIAALFPSFMIGAQADPYYGMDKDYKKVDKKISVSSLKCNNINVNVNGLTLDVFPPSLGILGGGDMAAEAADPTTDVASFGGSGGNDKSEFNNFKFICINNNNNTVIPAAVPPVPPVPPIPPVDECLLCFEQTTQAVRDAIIAALEATGPLIIVPGVYEVPADVITIEGLCEWLNENAPLELAQTQIDDLITSFINANPGLDREAVEALVQCFIDADLIDVVLPTCDDCFAALDANIITTINDLLAAEGPISIPSPIDYTIPDTVTNIAQLCVHLNANPITITNNEIAILVNAFVGLIGPENQTIAEALVDCLIEAGVINVTVVG